MSERRIPLAPAEGWPTVGLVVLMVLSLAWAVDGGEWVLRRGELTDFLSIVAVLGALSGFVAAKAGWSRWLGHAVGAAYAAVLVPLIVGGVLALDAPTLRAQYEATATAVVQATLDLTVRARLLTDQHGHAMLLFGLIVWGTGHFAAFAIFRHRRPLSAVMLVGLLLVTNMSATFYDQLWFLVVFSLAALLLLVRLHAFDEQSAWLRRRIGDPAAVAGIYLRGGTAFVTAAILGALVLTGTASSAPLAGAWTGIDQRLVELGERFQGFLQIAGPTRIGGASFGETSLITGAWVTDQKEALVVTLPVGEEERPYWRIYAYDRFLGDAWTLSSEGRVERPRGAAEPLLADTADEPPAVGRRELRFSVRPVNLTDDEIISPDAPVALDGPAIARLLDPEGFFGTIALSGGRRTYEVTALVPVRGEGEGELNEGALRGAGEDYPEAVLARYLAVPDGVVPEGGATAAFVERVRSEAPRETPYDYARTIVRILAGEEFTYDTDITDIKCNLGTVECFALNRRGYCQQFASLMAVSLRELGIPTRVAQGFLPGVRDAATGEEVVRFSDSHAWVEVWFPGFGWVAFDPTKSISQAPALPRGVDPSPTPRGTRPSEDPGEFSREPVPTPTGGGAAGPTPGPNDPGAAPYIAVTILLLVSMVALAYVAYRRGPASDQPDTVYAGIVRIASRLGFAPRPTQTVYEYTGSLGEVLPAARPELSTVARAKVEVAYGRRHLGGERIVALREAQRRLRVQLLRLVLLRRPRRRR